MKTERTVSFFPKIFKSIDFVKLLMVAIMLVCVACDDDDDEGGIPMQFLSGSPVFDLPPYAMIGDTITVVASGVTTDSVRYSWSYGALDSVAVAGDDNSTIRLRIPDSLAKFDITVTASAGDYYYNSIYTNSVTSVGSGSLTGTAEPDGTFIDARDSQSYGYVKVGNLYWMDRNLNWKGAGQGYGRSDAAAYVFGRLYTWNDATGGVSAEGLGNGVQGVCPEGWSIPTAEDWEDLGAALNGGEPFAPGSDWKGVAGKLMAGAFFNGEKIWPYSPEVDITNDFRWNALSGGTGVLDYTVFSNICKYGFWWTGAEKDSNNAYFRYIFCEYPNVSVNYSSKDGMAASVRCVKLAE